MGVLQPGPAHSRSARACQDRWGSPERRYSPSFLHWTERTSSRVLRPAVDQAPLSRHRCQGPSRPLLSPSSEAQEGEVTFQGSTHSQEKARSLLRLSDSSAVPFPLNHGSTWKAPGLAMEQPCMCREGLGRAGVQEDGGSTRGARCSGLQPPGQWKWHPAGKGPGPWKLPFRLHKSPQTGWLETTGSCSLRGLEARSPKPRCWQGRAASDSPGQALLQVSPLALRCRESWAFSHCSYITPIPVSTSTRSLLCVQIPLLIMTPVIELRVHPTPV